MGRPIGTKNIMRTPEENEKYNNLIWNGWKYLSRPFEVIVSDRQCFMLKEHIKLTMYFDAWNKEIVGYGLVSKGDIKSYYDGLKQVLKCIKKRTN